MDTLPCGVATFADDGIVSYANEYLGTLVGIPAHDIIGRHVEGLLTVSGRIFFQTHLYPLLRLQERADEIFLLLRHRDGSDVGVLTNAARRVRDGVAVTECVMLEVKERRKYEDELLRARREADAANVRLADQALELELQHQQMEEQATELEIQQEELQRAHDELQGRTVELEAARVEAEEANEAKSRFLATMSHELRTPLNAIGGYTELMELGIHGPLTEAQRHALDRIARSQRHLLRLVNEVLNLARIESGHVEFRQEELDLADVVASVAPMLEPQMNAAGLEFTTHVPPELRVCGDREKLQQVLINLLGNAHKFTPRGGRVSLDAAAPTTEGPVSVRVRDTGIGIPPASLDAVFEPFIQVNSSAATRPDGAGLGLAISRDLARGMGGDLTVTSEPGRGSTFTLLLPVPGSQLEPAGRRPATEAMPG